MASGQQSLSPGHSLRQFEIRAVLGQGGFGITYRGWDTELERRVAIKEFLPTELALRDSTSQTVVPRENREEEYQYGLQRFLEEARTLARFSHPNIVRVYAFFVANGSAYLVMEYEQGESLSQHLKRGHKPLPEEKIKGIVRPILKGLIEVHKAGFLHRDIKPGNIYLRDSGEPVLIDFGAARQAIGAHSRSVEGIVSAGYAPPEQYTTNSKKQGPWTDLYALGATLYRCISGSDPIDSLTRRESQHEGEDDPLTPAVVLGRGQYSPALLELIDQCLVLSYKQRPQDAAEVLAALESGQGLAGAPDDEPRSTHVTKLVSEPEREFRATAKPRVQAEPEPEATPLKRGGVATVLLLVALLGIALWYAQKHQVRVKPVTVKPTPKPSFSVGHVFEDSLTSGGKGPRMIVLPTGSFRMGDLSGNGYDNEQPVRRVSISRPIAMMTLEVTFDDYDRYARAAGKSKPDDRDWGWGTRPVINVSWEDAQGYARWLSQQTGKHYRMPSEAEWEYAARAGSSTKYFWGNTIGSNRANCDGCGSRWDNEKTAPAGSFPANEWGLYDMHGNVWEWVVDCYDDSYKDAPVDGSAKENCDRESRVLRGGCWYSSPEHLRSARRSGGTATKSLFSGGFRLVQDLIP